jgi:uncharacterized membrane protein
LSTSQTPTSQDLAAHIAASAGDVAAFHRENYRRASALQRTIDRVTGGLGRHSVVLAVLLGLGAWIATTAFVSGGGVDEPGFAWLELAGTFGR